MAAWIKILTAFAVAVELIAEQIKKYAAAKEKADNQKKHDAIDCDPDGYFLRKFRDKNKATNTSSNPGERNGTT